MLAIVTASLMSIAAAARSPCPDGTVIPADQSCPMQQSSVFFFDWNSARVTPEMEGILFNAIAEHRTAPARRIVLGAHTDRSGSASSNLRLSQRRARAIRRYLIERGSVRADLITIRGYGETRPLVNTADGVRERHNSRVEMTFESAW